MPSGHPVGRLPRGNGAGRGDDQRHRSVFAGLLHLDASGRPASNAVGRLPNGERPRHPDAGCHCGRAAGLPDGANQITSALVAYRSAANQDTATASALLSRIFLPA